MVASVQAASLWGVQGQRVVVEVHIGNGLPAFNIVAPMSASAPPVMKAVYSYPSDIVIEAPANARVQGSK